MRHILAVTILGLSLASSTSAALAYSRNNDPGIPQRSWDGQVAEPSPVVLYTPPTSTVAGSPEQMPYEVGTGGNGAVPMRSWDGLVAAPPQVVLHTVSGSTTGGSLSVVAGPGFDDGYNPYRPNPDADRGFNR